MTEKTMLHCCILLSGIAAICKEIQDALEAEVEKTFDSKMKEAWQNDIMTVENLTRIKTTIKNDIENERINISIALLLEIAIHDFKKRLEMIPKKKSLHQEIINSLKEVHGHIVNTKF